MSSRFNHGFRTIGASAAAYWRLARWWLVLLNAFNLINAFTLPAFLVSWRLAPPGSGILSAATPDLFSSWNHWPAPRVFATFTIAVPAVLGYALATVVRPVLQWRFALAIPGARRRLLASHATVLLACAFVAAAIARADDPAVSLFASFGIAAAAAACSLPAGNPHASRTALRACVTLVGVVSATAFAPELRAAAVQLPFVAGLLGLGAAAWFFRGARSPEDVRAADDRLFVPSAGMFGVEASKAVEQAAWRRPEVEGRTWKHGRIGDSALKRLRAIWYENYGTVRWSRAALGAAGLVAATLAIGTLVIRLGMRQPMSLREMGSIVYALICEPEQTTPPIGHFFAVIAATFFLTGTVMFAQPRTPLTATVSRIGRAQVAHLSALFHAAWLFAGFAATGYLLAALAALVGGVSFHPGVPLFLRIMLGTLPLLPLWQWYGFAEITARPLATKLLAIVGFVGALSFGGWTAIAAGPTGVHAGWLVVAVITGQWLHRLAVRRLYRTADLIVASAA